jgi:hypothetical protein
LTREEEKYYETYFDLFLHDGWKQLINEITESIETYDVSAIKDIEDLYRSQGELKILKRIASFETGIRNAYDMSSEGSDAEKV